MIDCVAQVVEPAQLGRDTPGTVVELGYQLLRAYREDGRQKEFISLKQALAKCPPIVRYGYDFIHQQTVLVHLENWRIKDALQELLDWDTSSSDALWVAKRAALLGEFTLDLAADEALRALTSLQNRPELRNLYLRSRESYVLWLTMVLNGWDSPKRQDLDRRRRSIQRKSFDAFNFGERLNEALQAPPKTNVSRSELLAELNPGETQVTRAYTMRRYIEETAGLVSSPRHKVYANQIKNAVPWMAISDPEEALRLSVRHRSSIKKDWTFPSHMLAALSRDFISRQFEGAKDTLTFLLEELGAPRTIRSSRRQVDPISLIDRDLSNSLVRSAVVHVDNLQSVLTEVQRGDFAELLLRLRRACVGVEWQTLNAIEEAIFNTLPTLPEKKFSELAGELIQQPINGHNGFPKNLLGNRDVIATASSGTDANPESAVQSTSDDLMPVVEKLLSAQERSECFNVRWNATLRLSFAAGRSILSPDQISAFLRNLDVLLGEVRADFRTAMNREAFHPADLLTLAVGSREVYRETVLDIIVGLDWPYFLEKGELGKAKAIHHLSDFKDPSSLAVKLTSEPWMSSKYYLKPSDWTKDHALDYLSKAQNWLQEEGPQLVNREGNIEPNDPFSGRGQLTWRLERVSKFCNNVALLAHYENGEVLAAAVKLLTDIDDLLPAYGMKFSPVLIKSGIVDASEMAARIRELYAGNDMHDKFNALMSVVYWAVSSDLVSIDPPPRDLVTEFAVIIRTRRAPDLGWALDIARIMVQRCSHLLEPAFYDDVLIGLSYLAVETSPKAPSTSVLSQNATLSDLRVSALELLAELPDSSSRNQVIERWQKHSDDEVDWKVRRVLETLGR